MKKILIILMTLCLFGCIGTEKSNIKVFEDVVTKNIKIPETQALQKMITEYDPLSTASLAYFNIALSIDEMIKKTRIKDKL